MSLIRTGTALVLAGALALGAGACGSDDDGDSGTTGSASGGGGGSGSIALLLPESKTARYENQDRPRFIEKVRELCPDCEVIYANAEQDPAQQQQQAEQAITNGARVLVIDAVDVRSAAAIANNARAQDVPVVSYARLIADADLDSYVSIDPFRVGQQQAQALLDAMRDVARPRIVMINGSPTDSNAGPYKDGAHDVFDRAGVEIVKEYDTPDWSPDRAQTEMEQAITSVGRDGFDGVYSANDGMAGGIITALDKRDVEVPVGGQDAELAGLQRLLTDKQSFTIYKQIKPEAETTAEIAVRLLEGKDFKDLAPTKVDSISGEFKGTPAKLYDAQIVTKDDIAGTILKDKVYKASDLCTAEFKKACDAAGIK